MIQVIALITPLLTGMVVQEKPSSLPVAGYVQQRQGKSIDYDLRYGKQCYDLMMHAKKTLFNETARGAGTAYRTRVTGTGFEAWTRFKPGIHTAPPLPGSIIFINAGHIKGHVALVVSATGDSVTILEQNGGKGQGSGKGSDAIRTKTIGYKDVYGRFTK